MPSHKILSSSACQQHHSVPHCLLWYTFPHPVHLYTKPAQSQQLVSSFRYAGNRRDGMLHAACGNARSARKAAAH
ncbi:hypothetical protein I7I51_07782 [Histoplasma capsulatum]|uniref:Uncharacterized protein n=1 Tax=Ajellomyces capsulatus TaxID=5037 RepID=A0A8A1LW02_AJECA|nr:hypothetical protein I7I51_07782 [Histoplasma capsulatum]